MSAPTLPRHVSAIALVIGCFLAGATQAAAQATPNDGVEFCKGPAITLAQALELRLIYAGQDDLSPRSKVYGLSDQARELTRRLFSCKEVSIDGQLSQEQRDAIDREWTILTFINSAQRENAGMATGGGTARERIVGNEFCSRRSVLPGNRRAIV